MHAADRTAWDDNGYFRLNGYAPVSVTEPMLARDVELCRAAASGDDVGDALVLPEQQGLGERPNPEDVVSKVFRLHRDPVFRPFADDPAITALAAELLGTDDVDCFLSQFIFKNPGAWGQPWHQDSYYFPFDPDDPVVGVWVAVTDATLENGCLHVLPGSHREPIHDHEPDRRPKANYGYVEIVDHDMTASTPVLMTAGDVLVFHSHLMHRSTDNESDGIRAAMVYHFGRAGTRDRTMELRGYTVNDWLPVRRAAALPAG
jgi:ectoine hydroxylase-related dioxygenase (phytanoyl-CoA dioxygenase family)